METPVLPLKESFSLSETEVKHQIRIGDQNIKSTVPRPDSSEFDPKGAWWRAYLDGISPESELVRNRTIQTVDLFCGAGGLALGLKQLCPEMGLQVVAEAIVDQDEEATRVYAANHQTRHRSTKSVSSLIDHTIRGAGNSAEYLYPPELIDETFSALVGNIDVVLAGPPCKGHSNLNNTSQGDDRRNSLYLTVPSIAIALDAPAVIIENVPEVIHDSARVVQTTKRLLQTAGYTVETEVLSAASMGWPQNRSRHFLVAKKNGPRVNLAHLSEQLSEDKTRPLWWAIGDLEEHSSDNPMDSVTELSSENRRRIDWLFENDEYDLALSERPESHQDGTSYTSVYGRLRKDEPAPTITTGFLSPGRGRYIHPTQKRVITPREAARLQGFPDSYDFVVDPDREPYRNELSKWIGDAVPMPLGYAASLSVLGTGLSP